MSTTDQLKKAVAPAKTPTQSQFPLINVLRDEKFKKELARALPNALTAERMARVLLTECRKNPTLLQCELGSVQSAIMQCAQLGLEPGSALGHAYLIPFTAKVKVEKGYQYRKECQLVIGYRGMLDLCRRSGQIQSVNAFCVHEQDEFSYELGLHPDIHHVPSSSADPGPMTYVYAVIQLKDGGTQFEVMSRAEIEAIRDNSQGYKTAKKSADKYKSEIYSPWATNFEEMSRKTVIRRMFKYLPMSIEVAQAMENEERGDRGESNDFIDGLWDEKDDQEVKFLTDQGQDEEVAEQAQAEPLPEVKDPWAQEFEAAQGKQ